jgi:hypothetical protein
MSCLIDSKRFGTLQLVLETGAEHRVTTSLMLMTEELEKLTI